MKILKREEIIELLNGWLEEEYDYTVFSNSFSVNIIRNEKEV